MKVKYAELVAQWLEELGYTHCFTVAGGNSMHLLDAVRKRMRLVPVVHEVAAGIGVEYFNEAAAPDRRAFALITAGPGLTNVVTALAGAHLESRELLVIGGQVKVEDLATGGLRQRGIQEVDGVSIAKPVTVVSERIEAPIGRDRFVDLVSKGQHGRPGPVFLEFCLDVQGAPVVPEALSGLEPRVSSQTAGDVRSAVTKIAALWDEAERPVLLIGGGVSRAAAAEVKEVLSGAGLPVMTTWNGMDRVATDSPAYAGRPNTWGQRAPNILLAQADLVLALGTRLGLQQTGFNWQGFAPMAQVVQVDIDPAELAKGHPDLTLGIEADANAVLLALVRELKPVPEWLAFCTRVRGLIGTDDPANETAEGYVSPFVFARELAARCRPTDVIVPCSSGGAFTTMMQAFEQQDGQVVITDKGLASMGYGLSGAVGAAIARGGSRVVLTEGDGGFAQNLQELATVAVNGLPIKMFIYANNGYASIRMTQRNYFGGEYVGCDVESGLGFPDWGVLFAAFGIPLISLDADWQATPGFDEMWDSDGPAGFVVPIDPEQTYFPKISSRVAANGRMESNPLYLMSPDLPADLAEQVFPYLDRPLWAQGATP